jgi:hypothetical protein
MLLELVVILSASVLIILFILSYKLGKEFLNRRSRLEAVKNFDSYMAMLQYDMNKAYNIIYKDRILIYSLDGMKIDDKQFAVVSVDFVNLTLKLLGPTLRKELTYIFGNEETFLFNIVEYFNSRSEEDEIRKDAKEELFNKEIDEET